jgi:transaldolase
MSIFLDTADLEEIQAFAETGVIQGVTTNPTIVARDTAISGWRDLEAHVCELAKASPGPLSVEVVSDDPREMVDQAKRLAHLAKNVCVKIPVHGLNATMDNLAVVRELQQSGIGVNVTAIFSAQQALLASLAGAEFVSLFAGRLCDQGRDPCRELGTLRSTLDRLGLDSRVIAGSTRHAGNVFEWLAAGADVVTVRPELLRRMLVSSGTTDVVAEFLSDGRRIGEPAEDAP